MPKYKIKNEKILNEFLDSFWKNLGRRKGNKFIKNLFNKDPEIQRLSKEAEKLQDKLVARLQGQDEPDWEKLAKDLEDY